MQAEILKIFPWFQKTDQGMNAYLASSPQPALSFYATTQLAQAYADIEDENKSLKAQIANGPKASRVEKLVEILAKADPDEISRYAEGLEIKIDESDVGGSLRKFLQV